MGGGGHSGGFCSKDRRGPQSRGRAKTPPAPGVGEQHRSRPRCLFPFWF